MQADRQKILNKFLKKIEKPNLKIKKRKNYKQQIDLFFNAEEVYIIQFEEDKTYGAVILIMRFQESRRLYYGFAEIILCSKIKPTLEDILQCSVHARINIGFDSIRIVSHKDIASYKQKFEKTGTVKIKDINRKFGTQGGATYDTFEKFCDMWNDNGGRRNKKKIRKLKSLLE